MPQLEEVLADAARVTKSANGAAPRFGHKVYEDSMCDLAEREARGGESIGAALSRLHTDRDERLTALAKAAYLAETAEIVLAERRARAGGGHEKAAP
ncbi:MAG: hypothetical protein OZ948_15475 [Deltaproteobacteria bacterium]|nr:hypothetical protein [Deltaproteobacteria bacterium]